MAQLNITLDTDILHGIFTSNGKDEAFSKLLESILNQVLIAQAANQIGAEPYERNDERMAYRNGFRDRQMTTRIGTITLQVPRLRNGNFDTNLFNRYQRSEQALVLAMIEMVINGVSTRKVTAVTEELCGKTFSRTTISSLCKQLDPIVEAFRNRPLEKHYPFVIVDAIYIKVREFGRVRSKGLLIATGVNEEGYREVIGFQLSDSESQSSWGDFFNSLKERGLGNVDIVVSDNHKGLVSAIRKHFQDTSWQRCQTHFSRNVLDAAPKSLQKALKGLLHQMYDAIDLENAMLIRDKMISLYGEKAPKAISILEDGFDDVMAVICLPEKYRKRLRTTNSIERLNEEIRRRERVIRIFPSEESAIRLIGALLVEQDEKWSTGRKYLELDDYYNFLKEQNLTKDIAAA